MNIIIAGDGRVGSTLARQLSAEGYDLTLIDSDNSVLESSMERYDVMAVHGNCASMAVPSRRTAQTSTRHLTMLARSMRETSRSLLSSSTRSSTISVRPLAKMSRRRKPGNCSRRWIYLAACFSGLIAMDRPKI